MSEKSSRGDGGESSSHDSTDALIRAAFDHSRERRVIVDEQFLDDEKLPETERVRVLEQVFHRNIRQQQIERLARQLAPVLGGECPGNLLIYGPSGTGKSVTCLHFLSTLAGVCREKGVDLRHAYVDLTTPRSCFGALNEFAIAIDPGVRRYRKGIALEQMQETIIRSLSHFEGMIGLVIDEVDNVTSDGDLLYTFLAKTLPKKVKARIFYLLLTNRLEWEKTIDPRILGVLKKTDVIFEPYHADDLVEILYLRVEKALRPERVDGAAVRKIAAYASRETGDARKAVELLVKAARLAEEQSGRLGEKEVDEANRLLEIDKTETLIASLPLQQKLALAACYSGLRTRKTLTTGEAYRIYCRVCEQTTSTALTQRRFSEMVSFLDIYGLINARVTSRGRYGKTRELSRSLPNEIVVRLLERSS